MGKSCDGIILQGGMTSSNYKIEYAKKAVELNNKKFAMSIKLHPELMLNEQYVDKIFKMFNLTFSLASLS